jgi:hypothetical protein
MIGINMMFLQEAEEKYLLIKNLKDKNRSGFYLN